MIGTISMVAIFILVGVNTHQSMRATDKQDKIIHLMWVIIFIMIAMIGVLEK